MATKPKTAQASPPNTTSSKVSAPPDQKNVKTKASPPAEPAVTPTTPKAPPRTSAKNVAADSVKPAPAAKAPAAAKKNTSKAPPKTDTGKTAVTSAAASAPKEHRWQEIQDILEKIKEDTLQEIKKSVKNGTDATATNEPGGDIYDQASSERDRELGLLLGDREREKLHNIDEALLRIVEGDYGICEECDEEIPLGRLKAMPFTRHCVKCKSDIEKLQAQTKRFEEERAYREIPLGSEEEDV